ncbi:MAG: hypothetical protein ACHQK9_08220 [Reyranellales bacterium]
MRYLHQSGDEICLYVQSLGLAVTKCHYANRSVGSVTDTSAIQEILKRSETLWGAALPYYLHVSKAAAAWTMPLKEAVSKIEASSVKEEFLVVAYQDGGIISVSGVVLPFHESARLADWWRPYRSALKGE